MQNLSTPTPFHQIIPIFNVQRNKPYIETKLYFYAESTQNFPVTTVSWKTVKKSSRSRQKYISMAKLEKTLLVRSRQYFVRFLTLFYEKLYCFKPGLPVIRRGNFYSDI